MPHRAKYRIPVGLRVCKTALAVTLSLWVAQLIGAYSPIFAGLGAITAMARTLQDALRDFRTQVVGLALGAAVSFLMLLISRTPSVLLTGAGVLTVMTLSCMLRLNYAMSMATIIVLSVGVSSGNSPMTDLAFRLLDTSVGLAVGLGVNMLIRPYRNRARVTDLLYRVSECVPPCLDARLLRHLYPDLTECEKLLRELDAELDIYRRQYFRRRAAHARNVSYLQGLRQLAGRVVQHLDAVATLDPVGVPTPENLIRLRDLGLDVSQCAARPAAETVDIVTNYHLEKVLEANQYLLDLLSEPPEPEEDAAPPDELALPDEDETPPDAPA